MTIKRKWGKKDERKTTYAYEAFQAKANFGTQTKIQGK